MRKRFVAISGALLGLLSTGFSLQSGKPSTPSATKSKPAALTDEEKEILKRRELLENLDLLLNFEKVRYLDFFTDKKGKEKPPNKLPAKENANKRNK
jgi:hypothetical protein